MPVRSAVRTDILHRRSRPGQTRREAGTQSQGSVNFAGRPVTGLEVRLTLVRYRIVKANLARFTVVLTLLASMALSLGAGIKWSAAFRMLGF